MKQFINRVDHIIWICRIENIKQHVAEMEKVSGVKFQTFTSEKWGLEIHLSWEAGLEVVAPLPQRNDFNAEHQDWLEANGEGVFGIVFGVRNLEETKARLASQGVELGPLLTASATAPWANKVKVREAKGPDVINTQFSFGQIDFADGVVQFVDV